MKSTLRKIIALVLCMAMVCSFAVTGFAAFDSDVAFQAVLDKNEVTQSDTDQMVVLTVKTNKTVDFFVLGGEIVLPDALELVSIASGTPEKFTIGSSEIDGKLISWCTEDVEDIVGITDLLTVTVKIPAGTAAGTYAIGVKDLVIANEYGECEYSEENAVTAELTVTASVVPPVVEGYSAAVSCLSSEATVGDTVSVNVGVTHETASVYAAGEVVLNYPASLLAFNEGASQLGSSAKVKAENGVLKLEDYGADKNCSTSAYVLVFNAIADGNAEVTLTSASFSSKEGAVKDDLTAATVTTSTAAIAISKKSFSVELPEIFLGAATVTEGESYTFTVADNTHYNYGTVSATMNGAAVTVVNNQDGSYTIANVTGTLVISGSRTAKTYTVSFEGNAASDVQGDGSATYGQNYSFTIPTVSGLAFSLDSVTIGGSAFTGYSVSEGTYTIDGSNVTGNIVVTVSKVQTAFTVTVEGSGAGAAAGYAVSAAKGSPYTLTIVPVLGYDYTVTAKMGGSDTTLVKEGNAYTIENVTGSIVFTVEQVPVVDGVSVTKYLSLGTSNMYLVKNAVALEEGSVSTYDGNAMFWSEKYNAYCYLVIAESLNAEAAAAKIGVAVAQAVSVSYGMDVNMSGVVDVNDAQLVYNMYNILYSQFTADVTMEKFLRADVNGDGEVNVLDPAAIVASLLA